MISASYLIESMGPNAASREKTAKAVADVCLPGTYPLWRMFMTSPSWTM